MSDCRFSPVAVLPKFKGGNGTLKTSFYPAELWSDRGGRSGLFRVMIATVLRRKVQDCPEGITHTTILLRRINRKLGPISQFKRAADLRVFMEEVLGLTLSRFGRPTWMLDDAMLDLLVRMAPTFGRAA
jgi:hypothetical protein